MGKNLTKEIRATFENETDQKNLHKLKVYATIHGTTPEQALAKAIGVFLQTPDVDQVFKNKTWLSQGELIETLQGDPYKITTNYQTLSNYRDAGRFDGMYCSDGKRAVYYWLEGVAEELKKKSTRSGPQKTAAIS